jgi:hypothetical protein
MPQLWEHAQAIGLVAQVHETLRKPQNCRPRLSAAAQQETILGRYGFLRLHGVHLPPHCGVCHVVLVLVLVLVGLAL